MSGSGQFTAEKVDVALLDSSQLVGGGGGGSGDGGTVVVVFAVAAFGVAGVMAIFYPMVIGQGGHETGSGAAPMPPPILLLMCIKLDAPLQRLPSFYTVFLFMACVLLLLLLVLLLPFEDVHGGRGVQHPRF